jgi:hypothetical protein
MPETDPSGGIQSFDIWVHQQMGQALHVSYNYFEAARSQYGRKFRLDDNGRLLLHTIAFDQLNNKPRLSFHVWLTQPVAGRAGQFEVELKLRPKTFFNKLVSIPWLASEGYLFQVFEQFPKERELAHEDLEALKGKFKGGGTRRDRHLFLVEKANMPDFVDLHAEKLFKSTKGKSNHEILEKQLAAFRQYLDKAVYHNLDCVYIVHGHGKGKLRREIHELLEAYPHVISYNNSYHPKFGYGATEVILG